MKRNKILNSIFSVFASFLLLSHTCGFMPFSIGKKIGRKQPVQQKDPLLPFVYPDKKITENEFETFLKNLNRDQKRLVYGVITGKSVERELEVSEIVKEMNWVSSHWVTYQFKDFDYHEMVMWTAEKVGVEKSVCRVATTFQLEHLICEKMFIKLWDKLTPEQRAEALKEANLDASLAKKTGATVFGVISGTLAAGSIAASAMGFAFYILMAKTVVVIMASVFGIPAATTIAGISALCGPVGWTIAGISIVFVIVLTGGASVEKCAATIIQIHALKVNAFVNSGESYQKYLDGVIRQ